MRLMASLPFRWQLAVGRSIGRLSGRLATHRRHIAWVNLSLCFPEQPAKARERLLREHFAALGMGVFETAMAWWASDDKLRGLAEITGLEHLERATARGKGVILMTGHFTTLELGARIITWYQSFHAMYRPHKNLLYETVMREARERRSRLAPLARRDIRGMLKSLKQGHAVWYAPDQNYGATQAVFVPFFGIPTLTITATSRLARMSGAMVLPYFPERLPGKSGYRVTILPPLEDFPSTNPEADALRINQLIEGWICRVPEQYLWVHRRFKSRPSGYSKVY
jgi:KDO2-lipid IV(A) lauroyltransferase